MVIKKKNEISIHTKKKMLTKIGNNINKDITLYVILLLCHLHLQYYFKYTIYLQYLIYTYNINI